MRAVQLIEPGRPLEDRAVELPRPRNDEVCVEIEAAGICRSDLHYRSGFPHAGPPPITLGHEIAGRVADVGSDVDVLVPGDRVAVHYLITCGECRFCEAGGEQFCVNGKMIGKDLDGGYADAITIPAVNAYVVPDAVPLEHAAIMMCSTSTSYHALKKARMAVGSQVAIFGTGGLGMSAIQLAMAMGAAAVYAVDIDDVKLQAIHEMGATPIDGRSEVAAAEIRQLSGGGVDIAMDLLGSPQLLRACVDAVGPLGRIVSVGLTSETFTLAPYADLIKGEHEIIGCADHLGSEIPELLRMAEVGRLDLGQIVSQSIPLEAAAVNGVLDGLARFDAGIRNVITPGNH